MSLILGIDTGGTFTDAALLDSERKQVVAHAKSLTTRQDLSIGVGKAIAQVIESWGGDYSAIQLVSLSTTLATNAVVEGVGEAVCLVLIGFDADLLSRAGLAKALGSEPCLQITGGHKTDGRQQAPLDIAGLKSEISQLSDRVNSFAVASHFATRNPEHECQTRDIISQMTGLPVTCSFELSSSLGGPRRALTALLNARLIGLLERLIKATEQQMSALGLSCPLMVVKGDGSLLRSDYARARPVETILSGPAASLAGAAFLAGKSDGLVADIGGTTTDIARLQGGVPLLSSDGANIGGWRTMIEAVQISTSGLGGDSEVNIAPQNIAGPLILGPRRAVPLSLLALDHPEIIKQMTEQLAQPIPQLTNGRFIIPIMPGGVPAWLSRSESSLAHKILEAGMSAVGDMATTQVAYGALERLVKRGLLMVSCFTPTDASHICGQFSQFNTEAARLGGTLLARQKLKNGETIAESADEVANMTLEALTCQSAVTILDVAFAEQGAGEKIVSSSPFLTSQLSLSGAGRYKNASATLTLEAPLIALGASAATYYPQIAKRLNAELNVPAFFEVAGAVGAAAGSVRQRVMVLITQPSQGTFRVHLSEGLRDLSTLDSALILARKTASDIAKARAHAAGAKKFELIIDEKIQEVALGANKTLFLQAAITAEASGTPSG